MSRQYSKETRNLLVALCFLTPNICGVLLFTLIPLVFSIAMAFTNWDLTLHNMFKDNPIKFIGMDNFSRLFHEGDFLRFFGNTLFLMLVIPVGMAGSLMAALFLSQEPGGKKNPAWGWVVASGMLIISVVLLTAIGMGASATFILMVGVIGLIMTIGFSCGVSGYRTLFYLPHFAAGVATFILWQKLYNPETGVINHILRPPLAYMTSVVNATPLLIMRILVVLVILTICGILGFCARRFRRLWQDGELGTVSVLICSCILLIPIIVAGVWTTLTAWRWLIVVSSLCVVGWQFIRGVCFGKQYDISPFGGMQLSFILALFLMAVIFGLVGLAATLLHLPQIAAKGLQPPVWLADYHWAKPALMFMMLWASIGSNNMLLYLAALTNVSRDLQEAAEIDGASSFQKFWHITWPSLAPVTFFIAVMSIIYGLQGGMEIAKTMTQGGPAGSTTTLSYFIYSEGFETGRVGYASAIAWVLFALVFSVTVINWKFGSRES